MNNSMLIISITKDPAEYLTEYLRDIFGDNIKYSIFSFSEHSPESLDLLLSEKPTLIAASGSTSLNLFKKKYPDVPILKTTRDITEPEFIDSLLSIPDNSDVLVVNETVDGASNTVNSLIDIGVTHLNYIPYWKGADGDFSNINIAVSPGMLKYCPKHITIKIDIGMRTPSTMFITEVMKSFDMIDNHKYFEKFINKKKRVLLNVYKRLNKEFNQVNLLKNSLQNIVNKLDEAIISINKNYEIIEINDTAESTLGIDKSSILGKNIDTVIGFKFHESSFDVDSDKYRIVTINKNQFYIDYIPMNNNFGNHGIFTFKKIESIQENDERIRRIFYKKFNGHVAKHNFSNFLYGSEIIKIDVIEKAKHLSKTESTILITGESGTGKEVLAQSIHNFSKRHANPFVAVNFAALPDNLVESELFGYEEGAFTGAKKSGKKGLFELAHTGTIFLDEIGDASMWVQTRLLRVLEEKEVMRLGDTKVIPLNIRIIAATNKNLKKLIEEGTFRADLYYRLNTFQIYIPALRERKDCINVLTSEFLRLNGISNKTFSKEANDHILNYEWNGNIRELKNMAAYISAMSKNNTIDVFDLPYEIAYNNTTHDYSNTINTDILPISTSQETHVNPQPISFETTFTSSSNLDLNSTEAISLMLKESYDLQIICPILKILSSNKHRMIKLGRNKILEILNENKRCISYSNLRTIFKHLENLGLIAVGKTKQGTLLTEKGEKVYCDLLTM